ncbi:hypothetical protein CPB86DRAFT_124731 [Serendipita vermifera]|nr:hypothetical protein CPB86DRAFT_124731 [Serendipita vermifera]
MQASPLQYKCTSIFASIPCVAGGRNADPVSPVLECILEEDESSSTEQTSSAQTASEQPQIDSPAQHTKVSVSPLFIVVVGAHPIPSCIVSLSRPWSHCTTPLSSPSSSSSSSTPTRARARTTVWLLTTIVAFPNTSNPFSNLPSRMKKKSTRTTTITKCGTPRTSPCRVPKTQGARPAPKPPINLWRTSRTCSSRALMRVLTRPTVGTRRRLRSLWTITRTARRTRTRRFSRGEERR